MLQGVEASANINQYSLLQKEQGDEGALEYVAIGTENCILFYPQS